MSSQSQLPEALAEACLAARQTMLSNTEHILSARARWKVLATLGSQHRGGMPFENPGRFIRTRLSLLSANRALSLFQKLAPNCIEVPAAYETALRFLGNQSSADEAYQRMDAGAEEVDSLNVRNPAAYFAGYSVLEALTCALQDIDFVDTDTAEHEPEDAQTGGDDNDAASFAAAAFARAAGDSGGDPAQARREFWTWWLDVAIPKAWENRGFDLA